MPESLDMHPTSGVLKPGESVRVTIKARNIDLFYGSKLLVRGCHDTGATKLPHAQWESKTRRDVHMHKIKMVQPMLAPWVQRFSEEYSLSYHFNMATK